MSDHLIHHMFLTLILTVQMYGKEDTPNPLVMNLSQHTLTSAETKILSRGLKFCPNPGQPDISTYQADLDKFHLRMKRYLYFLKPKRSDPVDPLDNSITPDASYNRPNDEHSSPDEPFHHRKFKNPSAWVPPTNASLEFFFSKDNLDLAKFKPTKPGRILFSSYNVILF